MRNTSSPTALTNIVQEVTAAIEEHGVVAVIRVSHSPLIGSIADALVDAGIRIIEVTLTSPGAVAAINELRERLPSDVLVGAGSVITETDVEQCFAAGACFAMSPNFDPTTIGAAQNRGLPFYPGILTPSEATAAFAIGVPAVKLFPASTVRPDYLKAIRAPLPTLRVIPTGGIRIDDVEPWIQAGALAVGLGGPLIGDTDTRGPDSRLAERAREALEGVRAARQAL